MDFYALPESECKNGNYTYFSLNDYESLMNQAEKLSKCSCTFMYFQKSDCPITSFNQHFYFKMCNIHTYTGESLQIDDYCVRNKSPALNFIHWKDIKCKNWSMDNQVNREIV